jgi:transcriptional regulator with XRE-family HTH domain
MGGKMVIQLGERIRAARKEANLRRIDLAVAAGTTEKTVQRWEQSKNTPTVDRLVKVAAATGKPISFFLGGEE